MTALLYFLNTVCATGQSSLGKYYTANNGNTLTFNISKALSGAIIFLLFGFFGGIRFNSATLIFGIMYGVLLCFSMHTGLKALESGPMALTSIIASFSLLIPFLFGITVLNERISIYNIFGIAFLLSSIIILNIKRENGFSLKWFCYAMLTMLANGICSVIQKCHQLSFPGKYKTEFTVISLFTALIILRILCFKAKPEKKLSLTGLFAGILNAVSNYTVLYLASGEKASVLFPMISIINILAVWLAGKIIFKEKLGIMQISGLVLGITAVILLKL